MTDPGSSPNKPPRIAASSPAATVSRWRWYLHLIVIGAYPLLIAMLGLSRDANYGPALSRNPKGLLLVCAVELLIFGAVFGLGWLASRATRDDLLWRWRPGWWVIPLGVGYSVAIRLAVGALVLFVALIALATQIATPQSLQEFFMANRPDVESVVDVPAMRQNPVYFWLTLTLVSFVVAGLREEAWRSGTLAALRHLWPRAFGSRRGQLAAVAVLAVIFGLGHLGQGPLAACLTGFLGFLLGAIMVFHQSMWPAVIAHGFFDATSLALLPWALEKLHEFRPAG